MYRLMRWFRHNPKQQRQFWTSTAYGQSILSTEKNILNQWLKIDNRDISIEIASLENPPVDEKRHIRFAAARSSWRSPVIATLSNLPLSNRSVDAVIWRYLPLDWQLRQALIHDIARVLAPGGYLLVFALNPLNTHSWRCYGIHHIGYQASEAIIPLARMAGLSVRQRVWAGPGKWRLAGLQGILLQKTQPSLQLTLKPKRSLIRATATAR